jgi:hypothetical protein
MYIVRLTHIFYVQQLDLSAANPRKMSYCIEIHNDGILLMTFYNVCHLVYSGIFAQNNNCGDIETAVASERL